MSTESGSSVAEQTRGRNRALFGGRFGPIYSFYMEHAPLARVIALMVWGSDIRPFYASMAEIGRVPDGGLVVDAPCGAGVAFRGLRPEQHLRYLAVDLTPEMLERARQRARSRGLDQIELVQADAEAIPATDGSADLFLSWWGLHCFAHPEAALAEAERCLRPGGHLLGGTAVTGRSLRQRLVVHPNEGAFGNVPGASELERWLGAGFEAVRIRQSGVFAYFSARKADRSWGPRYPHPRWPSAITSPPLDAR